MGDPPFVRLSWGRPNAIYYDNVRIFRNSTEIEPGLSVPAALAFSDHDAVPGENAYELVVELCGIECRRTTTIYLEPPASSFRRGDVDDDSDVDLQDVVSLLAALYESTQPLSCPDAADANDDGVLNIGDPVRLLLFLFWGGPEPPAPGASCGTDPDEAMDSLGPCEYSSC